MTRVSAAGSHLLLSLLIFSVTIWTLLFFWYPSPHFSASGGWQGLKIVAAVDLVLGPLLTLIIFDVTKSNKKLMGDITVIAIMQFSALVWGISTIYQQRPLAVVFWEDGFYSVPASALKNQAFELNDFKQVDVDQPALIYAEKPTTVLGLKNVVEMVINDKIAPHHQVNLYRPLERYLSKIKSLQVNINEIIDANTEMKADLEEILAETNKNIDDYLYFPLHSKYYNIILLFNDLGEIKDYITVPLREE